MAGMGMRGALLLGVIGALGVSVGVGACSDDGARRCAEQSGATFCVQRQGPTGVEPTAEGLLPGSTLSFAVTGIDQTAEPFTSEVGPDGVPDRAGVVGQLGAAGAVDPAGERSCSPAPRPTAHRSRPRSRWAADARVGSASPARSRVWRRRVDSPLSSGEGPSRLFLRRFLATLHAAEGTSNGRGRDRDREVGAAGVRVRRHRHRARVAARGTPRTSTSRGRSTPSSSSSPSSPPRWTASSRRRPRSRSGVSAASRASTSRASGPATTTPTPCSTRSRRSIPRRPRVGCRSSTRSRSRTS